MTDNEVDLYRASGGSVHPPSKMEAWARDLTQAHAVAVKLVTTSFVPATYQNRPEEAAAAIMTGAEVGLTPLAALRSIDIINGVPGMRAIALRALVQAAGHEIWVVEQTATRAVVRGRRRGSDQVYESVWTVERARQLNLLGKDNWKKQPIAMLLARATSECARLVAADSLLGIPYSIEELEDIGEREDAPVDVPPKVGTKRTIKRNQPKSGEVEELPLPADDVPPEPDIPETVVEAAPDWETAAIPNWEGEG